MRSSEVCNCMCVAREKWWEKGKKIRGIKQNNNARVRDIVNLAGSVLVTVKLKSQNLCIIMNNKDQRDYSDSAYLTLSCGTPRERARSRSPSASALAACRESDRAENMRGRM